MKLISILTLLLFILIFSSSSYAIDPSKEYILTPDSVGWKYEEKDLATEDNYNIKTWIYTANPDNDRRTVLIFASHDADNMSYMVYHAATLANNGFTVVTFDYRGFGKSSDFQISSDYLYYSEFSNDLYAVVQHIDSNYQGYKVGVWAMSMGTIITTSTFPRINDKIDFIIGEGFVTNTSAIVDRIETQKGVAVKLPESSESYEKLINSINVPVLVFSGSMDVRTTTNDALELKNKLGKICKVVEYEGGHLTGFQAWPDKPFGQGYAEQIIEFLRNR